MLDVTDKREMTRPQLERVISVDRALTMNTWESEVWSVAADLVGMEPPVSPDAGGPETDVHLWQWKS